MVLRGFLLRISPLKRFLLFFGFLFVLWNVIYTVALHPSRIFDKPVSNQLVQISSLILRLAGFEADAIYNQDISHIFIQGGGNLWIGDNCNGIDLFALFAIFIISFPGKWSVKMIFIPAGLLLIHTLNCFRIVALALIQFYSPQYLNFNHTYTFTIIMYCFIFYIWYLWVNRYSGFSFRNKNE